jgi:hypothetical protein
LFSATCDPPGRIADRDGRPYPRSFLAGRLNITEELFNKALKKSVDEGRIRDDKGVLTIVHWERYQSEYDRQRPYREAKKRESIFTTGVEDYNVEDKREGA